MQLPSFPSPAHRAAVARLAAATAHAGTAPVVEITFGQDDAHRLVVRYRAPAGVTHLDFLLADERSEREVRAVLMKPADDCARVEPGGLALRRGPGCEDGARFVVTPRALALDRLYEPAQPTSDGGVLFFPAYYAAAAAGTAIRWRFEPRAGDYGVDEGRRRDAPWVVEPGVVFTGPSAKDDPRNDDAWLDSLHMQQYVFLGHSPAQQSDGLLWVRDPALPAAIVDTVGRAGPAAWQAYASSTQVVPSGLAAVFMLAAPPTGEFTGYHGDRTAGNMIRLSFVDQPAAPSQAALERWSRFIAHETAHLWNHGVWSSDQAHPWLHEGDAEWAAMNAMHEAHLDSDAAFVGELVDSVNTCLVLHGETPEAGMGPRGYDQPYACGVALQFLGWAELRGRDPAAIDSALERWGQLHRAHPRMDVPAFAQFFDGEKSTLMHDLLQGEKTPFASTYLRDLASLVLVQRPEGEPTDAGLRERFARRLGATLVRADCGRVGFTPGPDGLALDADLACKTLPAGARITAVAGEPLATRPRAAWGAAHRACAGGKPVVVALAGRPPVEFACPAELPDAPAWIRLPDDALHRLRLMPRPVYAGNPPTAPLAIASAPNR